MVGKFRKPKPNVLKSNYLVPSLLLANAINPQDINDYGCLIAHLVLSTYKGCMTSKLWMGFLYIPTSWYILAFSNPHTPNSLLSSFHVPICRTYVFTKRYICRSWRGLLAFCIHYTSITHTVHSTRGRKIPAKSIVFNYVLHYTKFVNSSNFEKKNSVKIIV